MNFVISHEQTSQSGTNPVISLQNHKIWNRQTATSGPPGPPGSAEPPPASARVPRRVGDPPGDPHPLDPQAAAVGRDLGPRPLGPGSFQERPRNLEMRLRPEPDPPAPWPTSAPRTTRQTPARSPSPGSEREMPSRRRRTLVSVERGRRRGPRGLGSWDLHSFLLSLKQPPFFYPPRQSPPRHPPLPVCLRRGRGRALNAWLAALWLEILKKDLVCRGGEGGEVGGAVLSELFLYPWRAVNPPGTSAPRSNSFHLGSPTLRS